MVDLDGLNDWYNENYELYEGLANKVKQLIKD